MGTISRLKRMGIWSRSIILPLAALVLSCTDANDSLATQISERDWVTGVYAKQIAEHNAIAMSGERPSRTDLDLLQPFTPDIRKRWMEPHLRPPQKRTGTHHLFFGPGVLPGEKCVLQQVTPKSSQRVKVIIRCDRVGRSDLTIQLEQNGKAWLISNIDYGSDPDLRTYLGL